MTATKGPPGPGAQSALPPALRPNSRIQLLLVFAAWTLIAAFDIGKRFVESRMYGRALDMGEVLLNLESAWVWTAFTPIIFFLAERYPIERAHWARRLVLHFAFSVAIAGLDSALDRLICPFLSERSHWSLARRFWGESFINVYSYFATLAAGLALRFYGLYHDRRLRVSKLETELAVTKLRALEMRLRPHFLYNALHTIGGLVRTEQGPAAIRMIAGLGDLLRHTLRDDEAQEVPLSRELELTYRYLDIEQARFGDRLRIDVQIAPETTNAHVPSLLLQPLVENAVRHGVEMSSGGGQVVVRAYREGDALCLDVQDSGNGPRDETIGSGIGLSTTRARLEQLYGRKHKLELERAASGGALASVRIPFHTSPMEIAR
jgi:two-component system, LytTR family, sensor kinase